MKTLLRLSSALFVIERALLVLLFSLMIGLAFTQVVLRNVFSVGLIWADPLLRNGVLWLGFIGASLATRENKHIRIDLIGRNLKPRAARVVSVVTDLFMLAVCIVLADASLTFVRNEIGFEDTLVTIGQFGVPTWWSQVILPAGFAMVSLRIVIGMLLRLGGRGEEGGGAPAGGMGGNP